MKDINVSDNLKKISTIHVKIYLENLPLIERLCLSVSGIKLTSLFLSVEYFHLNR